MIPKTRIWYALMLPPERFKKLEDRILFDGSRPLVFETKELAETHLHSMRTYERDRTTVAEVSLRLVSDENARMNHLRATVIRHAVTQHVDKALAEHVTNNALTSLFVEERLGEEIYENELRLAFNSAFDANGTRKNYPIPTYTARTDAINAALSAWEMLREGFAEPRFQ